MPSYKEKEKTAETFSMMKNGILSCKFTTIEGSISHLARLYLITQKSVNRERIGSYHLVKKGLSCLWRIHHKAALNICELQSLHI